MHRKSRWRHRKDDHDLSEEENDDDDSEETTTLPILASQPGPVSLPSLSYIQAHDCALDVQPALWSIDQTRQTRHQQTVQFAFAFGAPRRCFPTKPWPRGRSYTPDHVVQRLPSCVPVPSLPSIFQQPNPRFLFG